MRRTSERCRVLVVDDSRVLRRLIVEVLSSEQEFEVVGEAADPYEARELIKQLNPDVLTLDVHMPRMSGLKFLENLMRLRPMPVVMVSSHTQENAPETLRALELGAVECVPKPKSGDALELFAEALLDAVRVAMRARIRRPVAPSASVAQPDNGLAARAKRAVNSISLIAIGASTGGTEAIAEILTRLPPGMPPLVIVQHIPAEFSAAFAARLNRISGLDVREASDGELLLPGTARVAPGGKHLTVDKASGGLVTRINCNDPVNRHRPSVDVLFDSVVSAVGTRSLGLILTGMGADGALGLVRLRSAGAMTIAQDEASSIVWGMPGEAVKRGGAVEVLPLDRIAAELAQHCSLAQGATQ